MKRILFYILIVLLAGCIGKPREEVPPIVKVEPPFRAVEWGDVDGWSLDHPAVALEVFQKSCKAVGKRKQWQTVCAEA